MCIQRNRFDLFVFEYVISSGQLGEQKISGWVERVIDEEDKHLYGKKSERERESKWKNQEKSHRNISVFVFSFEHTKYEMIYDYVTDS